jgi:hypothetical protein
MQPIPKSGIYFPNKFTRILLLALEDVLGKNGVNAVLNMAFLSNLIGNYPPENLEREFDFSDYSAIFGGLEEMYGIRGGRGLALRSGRATFNSALKSFGAIAGFGDVAFKVLPLSAKLRIGLPAVARVFSTLSDQHTTIEEKGDHYLYIMDKCPQCWGRSTDKPSCFSGIGLLQACLHWFSGGGEFKIQQITARSCGDETCTYFIPKTPIE